MALGGTPPRPAHFLPRGEGALIARACTLSHHAGMAERHPEQPARLCLCWSERSLQARLREGKRPAASVSEECAHKPEATQRPPPLN